MDEQGKETLKSLNLSDNILSDSYDKSMPKMVYMAQEDWDMHKKEDASLPVKVTKNEFILSNAAVVNKVALESQGINSNTAILCLAASGLDIMLPNISFNMMADEEIEKIREVLHEERVNYLSAAAKIADESYERIKSGDFSDILIWAQDEVTFKLVPKARILEEQITKIKKETLKNAGFSFWKEGVPKIGRGYLKGGLMEAAKITGEEVLKLTTFILSQNAEHRSLPEIAYALKISKMR